MAVVDCLLSFVGCCVVVAREGSRSKASEECGNVGRGRARSIDSCRTMAWDDSDCDCVWGDGCGESQGADRRRSPPPKGKQTRMRDDGDEQEKQQSERSRSQRRPFGATASSAHHHLVAGSLDETGRPPRRVPRGRGCHASSSTGSTRAPRSIDWRLPPFVPSPLFFDGPYPRSKIVGDAPPRPPRRPPPRVATPVVALLRRSATAAAAERASSKPGGPAHQSSKPSINPPSTGAAAPAHTARPVHDLHPPICRSPLFLLLRRCIWGREAPLLLVFDDGRVCGSGCRQAADAWPAPTNPKRPPPLTCADQSGTGGAAGSID